MHCQDEYACQRHARPQDGEHKEGCPHTRIGKKAGQKVEVVPADDRRDDPAPAIAEPRIAGRLRLSPESAYLLLFRFTMQEAMEYWPPSVIAEAPPEYAELPSRSGFNTRIEAVTDLPPQATGIFSEMLASVATPSLSTSTGHPKRYTVRIS